jgi:hypothetical protein
MSDSSPGLKLVAGGFSFPTSIAFDETGDLYVAESGLPFGGAPPGGRIWRIAADGGRELLADGLRPPVNGLLSYGDGLYISEGGHPARISRLDPDGRITTIVDGLPGPGNYHTNMAVCGPDGKLYFSQGAMTNTGIVGLDAYELGWLRRLPHAHDIPGHDIVLAGVNAQTSNPLTEEPEARTTTGAFMPFGTPSTPGQHISAQVPCTAAILRGWRERTAAYGNCPMAGCWLPIRGPMIVVVGPSAMFPICYLRSVRVPGMAVRTLSVVTQLLI